MHCFVCLFVCFLLLFFLFFCFCFVCCCCCVLSKFRKYCLHGNVRLGSVDVLLVSSLTTCMTYYFGGRAPFLESPSNLPGPVSVFGDKCFLTEVNFC